MTRPTPHIEANDSKLIAKTVLMPGDPLRAKFIADTYLTNVVQFNSVRGMFGFTGNYRGKPVSVMGSGMGNSSIGIYSYELYAFYDVETIIRVGSAGSYDKDINIYDLILAKDCWSESTYAKAQSGYSLDTVTPDAKLNEHIMQTAKKHEIPIKEVRVHTTEVFYRKRFEDFIDIYNNHGCKAVEMECFALFSNAKLLNKKAACILTISDSLVTHEATNSEERQNSFTKMMELVLEAV